MRYITQTTPTVRRAGWLVLVVTVFCFNVGQSYAITQRGLYSLGINYFDLADSCEGGGTTVPAPTTTADTAAQQIASTFIVGFSASTPKDVITDLATKYHIGGMYLIDTKDAAGAGFTKTFYDSLDTAAGKKLVIASDEEGGQVMRYAYPAGSFPAPSAMASQSNDAVKAIGQKASAVMASNGITTDLAPVLDLRSVGVTGRSFSNDPSTVADKAGAFTEGLKTNNVKPVFKHFPGFDSTTSGNTDDTKVVMTGSIEKTVDPYRTLLAKYPDAGLMLSNMYVNTLDKNYPSSLSAATVQYVRGNLNFSGLITTDDLGVSSVTNKAGSLGAAVSTSLQAGVTMPLFTLKVNTVPDAEAAMDKIIAAVQGNSAAMTTVTSNQSIIQKFRGTTAPATPAAPATTTTCCTNSAPKVTGADNPAKIWNYFIQAGVGAAGTAGILGNMSAETSGFNPADEQRSGAWEDMSNRNINEGGKGGVGLVQWDGGRRPAVIKYLLSHGLTDAELHDKASEKLLLAELDYIMVELNGNYKSTLTALKAEKDPAQAAYIFHKQYEVSADEPSAIKKNRMDPAVAFYNKYNGSQLSNPISGGTGSGSCSSGQSADCTDVNAQGVAKILSCAKKYDPVSYVWGAGHAGAKKWKDGCTTIGPSCGLDCSGLVNIAVYDAFGVDLMEDTSTERTSSHWTKIDISQVQPGDIVQPNTGHVEIIDHIESDEKGRVTLFTFGAHNDNVAQPDQVSLHTFGTPYNSSMLLLHFNG